MPFVGSFEPKINVAQLRTQDMLVCKASAGNHCVRTRKVGTHVSMVYLNASYASTSRSAYRLSALTSVKYIAMYRRDINRQERYTLAALGL